MDRLRPASFVGLPLLVLGWLCAHELAYELARDDRHLHGYLAHTPLLAGTCAAVFFVGFLARAAGLARSPLPLWAPALVPTLGFTVQEHVERAVQLGGVPWGTVLEPVFLLGLLLQAPFAVAVALLARALTAVADAMAVRRRSCARFAASPVLERPTAAELRPVGALATGHAGRAPPVPA